MFREAIAKHLSYLKRFADENSIVLRCIDRYIVEITFLSASGTKRKILTRSSAGSCVSHLNISSILSKCLFIIYWI